MTGTLCGLQICTGTACRELYGMGFHGDQLPPCFTSTSAMQSVALVDVKNAVAGFQSGGDVFSGVTYHASVPGFGSCQDNRTSDCSVLSVGLGGGFRSWARPLSSSQSKSSCFSTQRQYGQFHPPDFVGTVWERPLPVPT